MSSGRCCKFCCCSSLMRNINEVDNTSIYVVTPNQSEDVPCTSINSVAPAIMIVKNGNGRCKVVNQHVKSKYPHLDMFSETKTSLIVAPTCSLPMATLESLVSRLENVARRLEAVADNKSGGSSSGTGKTFYNSLTSIENSIC